LIWIILVTVVFVGGGSWLVARTWRTRGIVFFAGLAAAIVYMVIGKPNMPDDPLIGRLEEIAAKPESELTGVEYLALQEQRLKSSPKDPEPHKKIGDLYAAAGRPSEAMLAYNAALARQPGYQPALDAISSLQFQVSGEVDQATRDRLPEIRDIARADPNALTAVQLMALLQDRAAATPDDPMAYRMMGRLLEEVGQGEKAIAAWSEALKRAPNDIPTVTSLADIRFKASGTFDDETTALYHRVYKAEPNNWRAGYFAGIGDWVNGRKVEAEALWTKLEARNPPPEMKQMFAAFQETFKIVRQPANPAQTQRSPG
jgi:cytochrome c-type biogenesis protein CcmH/NrfG